MSEADDDIGGWARDFASRHRREEGEPLSEAELALVDRFVARELDDDDAEYVAIRATDAWTWENAIAAARLARYRASGGDPTPAETDARPQTLRFGPIASLAAADAVKATVPWNGGTIRLLQTKLRADLAIELRTSKPNAEGDADFVYILSVAGASIALLADASPVFSRLHADQFASPVEASLECVPIDALTNDQLELLRRAKRNLRDPVDLPRFAQAIARAEGGR